MTDEKPTENSAGSEPKKSTRQRQDVVAPERLDSIISVTSPKAWLLALAFVIVIVFIGIWLFVGRIPTIVQASGMLINTAGIRSVNSAMSGRIIEYDVSVGDLVKRGQIIAKVEQIQLEDKINDFKEQLEEAVQTNLEREKLRKSREESLRDKVANLEKSLKVKRQLFKEGLILEQNVVQTQESLNAAQNEIDNLKIERLNDQHKISGLQRDLENLNDQYRRETAIVANFDGKIVEIKESAGAMIGSGAEILTLELTDPEESKLQAIMYVSLVDGKKVKPGMDIRVIPSIVNPEEYGSLKAEIKMVSAYPATSKAMQRVFQNSEIVSAITQKTQGSALEIHADLFLDSNSYSGYKWSSKKGPPITLQSGTLCDGKIKVAEKRPIELIIPQIKQLFVAPQE